MASKLRVICRALGVSCKTEEDLIKDRLLDGSVRIKGGCRIWQGGKTSGGYGSISVSGVVKSTHRVSYESFVGPIPDGLDILHSCDTPACIAPKHLRAGTQLENNKQSRDSGRWRPPTKLSRVQVESIIQRRKNGEPLSSLANSFGVSRSNIHCIVTGQTWKDIQLERCR